MRPAAAPRLRAAGGPAAIQRVGLVVFSALVAALAAVVLHGSREPARVRSATAPAGALEGQATWAAGMRPAPAITTLPDQTGRRFTLSALHGRSVVVTFWDSHCTQQCPLAGRALASAEQAVPRAQRPVVVVVSVNPLDTPGSARRAMRRWGLAGLGPWHWLMGDRARLEPVWRAYRIAVMPTRTDIVHTEALYLIDRHGDERSGYLYPYLPARVASDLRRLAAPRTRSPQN
ncbi:MAG TPA: SCO family protein [Solirubrobacteraceae bacterium]|nr:SCO family protein [Solirubrobacteraceae bacterium]